MYTTIRDGNLAKVFDQGERVEYTVDCPHGCQLHAIRINTIREGQFGGRILSGLLVNCPASDTQWVEAHTLFDDHGQEYIELADEEES